MQNDAKLPAHSRGGKAGWFGAKDGPFRCSGGRVGPQRPRGPGTANSRSNVLLSGFSPWFPPKTSRKISVPSSRLLEVWEF